jgi:hypothetical protein
MLKWTSSVFMLILLLHTSSGPATADSRPHQNLAEKLSTQVAHFGISGQTLLDGIVGLAYRYELLVGWEYIDREAVERPLSIQLPKCSVREAVEALVRQLPAYCVTFSPEIIQIYSPSARADPKNLLNLTVGDFHVVDESVPDIDFRLWGEIFTRLHPGKGYGGHSVGGLLTPEGKITINLRDAKVYEVLDAVVAAEKGSWWIVSVPAEQLSSLPSSGLWEIHNFNPFGRERIPQEMKRRLLESGIQTH